jgi:putative transposase
VVHCYGFIQAEEDNHAVARLCRALHVARAGSYAWRHRPSSAARAQADAALTTTIQQIHPTRRGTYGSPRMHAE